MINIVQDIGLIEYGTEGRKARHVLAKCPKCSTKFSTRLDNLKRRNTGLCPSCSYSNAQKSNRIAAANRFKEKATKLHNGLYTYEKTKYTKVKEPVQIHCTKCDKFFMQTPDNHLQGKGCPYCAKLTSGAKRRSKYAAIFAGKADALHPGAYDYSLVQYTYANAKVKITCNTCLTTFEQTPNDHLCGRGCPECKNISDYDTLYIWNIPDTDIYKIGVTSKRLGMERINSVAAKIGVTPNVILTVNTKKALALEAFIHKTYINHPICFTEAIDGRTEFRVLKHNELMEILFLISTEIQTTTKKETKHLELIEQIHGWNKKAGLLTAEDRELESTMLLEEVLEGLGIPNPRETSRTLISQWKAIYPDRTYIDDTAWLDHLCDIEFILHGSKAKLGLTPEQDIESLSIVANANDKKLDNGVIKDDTGKVTKDKNFKGPEGALESLLQRRANPAPKLKELDEE